MGGSKTPSSPAPQPMPDPQDTLLAVNKKKQAAIASTQSGRAATLLSGGGNGVDKLGN